MMRILYVLAALILFSCGDNQKTISKEEMKIYEKELKEKIQVAKVEIVKMKLKLKELGDSLNGSYNEKIDDFEQRLNLAEDNYREFKDITQKELWTKSKATLDSTIGFLEIEIDTTKTNIEQLLKNN